MKDQFKDNFRSTVRKKNYANFSIPDNFNATVYQALSNLGKAGVVPRVFEDRPDDYIDLMDQEKNAALGQVSTFVDDDEDESLEESEEGRSRMAVWRVH